MEEQESARPLLLKIDQAAGVAAPGLPTMHITQDSSSPLAVMGM